jgi:hypothetical protein
MATFSSARVVAKYTTRCDSCDEWILPGQIIEYDGTASIHEDCERSVDEPERPERDVCTGCFLQVPCPCEDDQ